MAAAAVLTVAVVSFWLWRRSARAGEFITQPVQRGPIRSVVNATGTVQALLTVQVGSQISAQVEGLYADYNSVVHKGQLLAKLDPRRYEAELTGARANLASTQARVKTVEADLNSQIANRQGSQANVTAARVARDNSATILARYETLRQQGILSQNDYDTAKANADSAAAKYDQAVAQGEQVEAQIESSQAQVDQARAQVQQSQADLEQAQVNLAYTNITSPVDGVVVSRNVDVGQTVAASLSAPTLFVIANDLSRMQVHASVDEADIGSISQAATVHFTVDAYPNRNFTGTIAEIRLEPQSVQNVVTYTVIVDVDNERLELKPGMTANIAATVAEHPNALKVPNTALRYLPPGKTREELTTMLREPGAELASLQPGAGAAAGASPNQATQDQAPARRRQAGFSQNGAPVRDQGRGQVREAMRDEMGGQAAGAGRGFRRGAGAAPMSDSTPTQNSAEPLAPGQMWNPADKIQFPAAEDPRDRPGVVWVLDARKQPEPRRIIVGITDGTATEVVSGQLEEGDQVVVGDTAEAGSNTVRTGQGQGSGGGGRGGFMFGGPR